MPVHIISPQTFGRLDLGIMHAHIYANSATLAFNC